MSAKFGGVKVEGGGREVFGFFFKKKKKNLGR